MAGICSCIPWAKEIKIKLVQKLPQHETLYPYSKKIKIPSFKPHFLKFSKTVFYEERSVEVRNFVVQVYA